MFSSGSRVWLSLRLPLQDCDSSTATHRMQWRDCFPIPVDLVYALLRTSRRPNHSADDQQPKPNKGKDKAATDDGSNSGKLSRHRPQRLFQTIKQIPTQKLAMSPSGQTMGLEGSIISALRREGVEMAQNEADRQLAAELVTEPEEQGEGGEGEDVEVDDGNVAGGSCGFVTKTRTRTTMLAWGSICKKSSML